jgi:hypothetical protein
MPTREYFLIAEVMSENAIDTERLIISAVNHKDINEESNVCSLLFSMCRDWLRTKKPINRKNTKNHLISIWMFITRLAPFYEIALHFTL